MTERDLLERTRAFVEENFLYMRKNKQIGDEDSLLRTGVITSLGMMELVGWVEEEFGIIVDPADITEQNFDSLRNVARFIAAKQALSAA